MTGPTRQLVRRNPWLVLAGINGFIAVAAAAFGAHSLEGTVTPAAADLFRRGADWQLSHALALVGVAFLLHFAPAPQKQVVHWCGISFQAGILLFCGSLYWLGLQGPGSLGPMSMLTPIGGAALLVGWGLLTLSSWRVIWRDSGAG